MCSQLATISNSCKQIVFFKCPLHDIWLILIYFQWIIMDILLNSFINFMAAPRQHPTVICGTQLLIHAWNTCFWHQRSYIQVISMREKTIAINMVRTFTYAELQFETSNETIPMCSINLFDRRNSNWIAPSLLSIIKLFAMKLDIIVKFTTCLVIRLWYTRAY